MKYSGAGTRSAAQDTSLDSVFEPEQPATTNQTGTMLAVLAGIFLVQADLFATLVALPSIQVGLGFDGGSLQFLVAGYAIANASLLISSGRLGDLYGSRRIYLASLALFALASLGAAFSAGLLTLAVARTLQGAAAALLQPQVLGILTRTYQGESSKRAFAAYAFTMGLGSVAGQILGGLLVSLDVMSLGWRAVFLAMAPAALICFAIGWVFIPAGRPERTQGLDWTGVGFSIVLLSLITAPLTIGKAIWSTELRTWLLCAAPVVGLAFVRHQLHLSKVGRAQMLPTRLLTSRSTQIDLLAVFAFFCGVASFHVLETLYLQQVQGASALRTGFVFSSMAVGFMIASAAAPALAARWRWNSVAVGALALAASHAFNVAGVMLGWGLGALTIAIFTAGLSLGLIMGPLMGRVLARAPRLDVGAMSGLVATLQASANAIGVALVPLPFIAAAATADQVELNLGYSISLGILTALAVAVAGLTARSRE